ncbi:MAG: hypothetical protein WC146_01225 [Patescibacteria group bacterium]|jgi:hypothetical protein
MKKILKKFFSKEKFIRVTLPIILVIVLAIIGIFLFKNSDKTLTEEEATLKAETFINEFLMASGNKATIKDITTEYGLYKLKLDVISDVVESYISKDGKLFFPQALDIDEINATKGDSAVQGGEDRSVEVSVKKDKPTVELFVMSYCPYGTQVQKGILPVLETLGNKIDFELKFCNYIMHGEEEIDENLNQYCIQKEQPEKLNAYLQCFLEAGDSAGCLTTAGVNKSKISSCISKTDKEYDVKENFKNKIGYQGNYPGFDVNKTDNSKYNVGGSPTLVINGQEVSSGRDSASLLKTICSAFTEQPEECNTVLSNVSPSAGFGFSTNGGTVNGGCE